MPCNNSPLETLASFFIAFAAGVITVLALAQYVAEIKGDSQRTGRAP